MENSLKYMLDSNVIINLETICEVLEDAKDDDIQLTDSEIIDEALERRFYDSDNYKTYMQMAESLKILNMMNKGGYDFDVSPTVNDECKRCKLILNNKHINLLPELSSNQKFLREYISSILTEIMPQEIKVNAKNDTYIVAEAYIYGRSVASFDNHFVGDKNMQGSKIKEALCTLYADDVVKKYSNEIDANAKNVLIENPKTTITKYYAQLTGDFNFDRAMKFPFNFIGNMDSGAGMGEGHRFN